jgi:coproporphyrinogen III oxidase
MTLNADIIQDAFRSIQDHISAFLHTEDASGYREDRWTYEAGSGGGVTRIWERAKAIERGGVNFSAIRGTGLPASAATQFQIAPDAPFLATGVSLVVHPWNPYVPTIHMNMRYFEAGERWWFGGGIDLTPYYPKVEDVVGFHRGLKRICEEAGGDYKAHKRQCDEYFYIPHRGEMRGVGGIFFDHLCADKNRHFTYVTALGMAFPSLYGPFWERYKRHPYSEREREFQLYRRSRYVEFNLCYDRGTRFGLQSGGRVESILMSMPATAIWKYDWKPAPGSAEEKLQTFYLKPQDWISLGEAGNGPAPVSQASVM